MANEYGAQAIPFERQQDGFPVGDVALGYFGQFLQAAINRACASIWESVSPGRRVVEFLNYIDPQKIPFEENRLPALFVWRGRRTRERIGDGMFRKGSSIEVAWICEPSQEDHFVTRDPMANAILDAVDEALAVQRCPDWIVPGDTDAQAAACGSLVNTWTGFDFMLMSDSQAKQLTFERIDGDGRSLPYYGFAFSIDVTEHLELDPSLGAYPNTAIATYRTNGDAITDTTVNYPDEA